MITSLMIFECGHSGVIMYLHEKDKVTVVVYFHKVVQVQL